jgi:hypothetical protein
MSLKTVNVHTLGLPLQDLRTKDRRRLLTPWFDYERVSKWRVTRKRQDGRRAARGATARTECERGGFHVIGALIAYLDWLKHS